MKPLTYLVSVYSAERGEWMLAGHFTDSEIANIVFCRLTRMFPDDKFRFISSDNLKAPIKQADKEYMRAIEKLTQNLA